MINLFKLKKTRYFATFYHFPVEIGYHTGCLTTFNVDGNYISPDFVINHLLEKYKSLTENITIVETFEINKVEFDRFNKDL